MAELVSITSKAIKEIKNILKNKGIPSDYGLRLGVKGARCGMAFRLGFDHKKEGDVAYFVEDIQVLIQKNELLFLMGKQINFYDEAEGRGFMFEEEATPAKLP